MMARSCRQQRVLDHPCTALRSLQKISGLFDTGVTGVTHDDPFTSATIISSCHSAKMDFNVESDQLHSDAMGLLTALEKTDLGDIEGLVPLENISDLDSAYLDAFTDLSDLLGDCSNAGTVVEGEDALWNTPENVTGLEEVKPREILPPASLAEASLPSPPTMSFWPVLEGGTAEKRTAQVAFESAEHTPSNPDHNDYILKRKKFKESAPSAAATAADSTTKPMTKAEKYVERRRKNNMASKRSRETRKQKFTTMELQAIQLEKDNEALRAKVAMLEKMAAEMKATLVQKLAQGK